MLNRLDPRIDRVRSETEPLPDLVDLDASVAEVLAAPAFPTVPVAVLTKTASFAGLHSVPGLPADEVNQLYEKAQDDLVTLTPATPNIIATGSDHYIQFSQPDLVVRATDLVEYRAKQ